MSIHIFFDEENDVLVQQSEGHLNTDDLIKANNTVYQDNQTRCDSVLWDNRDATTVDLSYDHMKMIALSSQSLWKKIRRGKTAILVPDRVEFGMARMYQALVSEMQRDIAIFDSYEEAMNWLKF